VPQDEPGPVCDTEDAEGDEVVSRPPLGLGVLCILALSMLLIYSGEELLLIGSIMGGLKRSDELVGGLCDLLEPLIPLLGPGSDGVLCLVNAFI
jgi:hypothetical protein